MAKLIALFYYSIFVSAISGGTTNEGFLLLGGNYLDGSNNGSNYLDNVEAYGSNLSLPSLPSLPLPLSAPIAEMTESGAIYLTGGVTSDKSTNNKTFMLSSLNSSVWEELEAMMPHPVEGTASVVVGDIILVFGGSSHSLRGSINLIQMLNTNKSLPTWKLLNQTLPEPLYTHSAAVFEDQVIIVTGTGKGVTYTTSVSSIISDTKLDWVKGELPDVEGDGWSPIVEVCDGKLVAVHDSNVFTKNTMDSQWIQLEPLPQEKHFYPSIGSVRGNIVVGGGADGDNRVSSTVFMWVEASSEWEEVTSLKISRWGQATVQLPRGDYNYYPKTKPTTTTNRTLSPNN